MSKRLDSITRPSSLAGAGSGAKPALKFKPKVVSRKSKEERENTGKINTPGVNKLAEKNSRKLANKKAGAGANRNNKLSGTQLVISGPLSEGTISLGGAGGASGSSSNSRGASNPLLERLKLKNANKSKAKVKKEEDGTSMSYHVDDDSDSDVDDNAIDMGNLPSKAAEAGADGDVDLDQIDTDLFPVRAERNEHREYGEESKQDKTIKTEFHHAESIIPSEPATRDNTVEPSQKSKSASPDPEFVDANDENLHMNDYQEQQEYAQIKHDYSELSKTLKSLNLQNDDSKLKNMCFLQLPCSLPVIEGGNNGLVGKIRIHKSGKISMKIGKVKFDVSRGGSSDFVQDVVLVDPVNSHCYHVGSIKEKITAIPKIM